MNESTSQPLLSGLRVVDMTEALAGPQVIARDFIVEFEHPGAGLVRSLGFPPHLRAGAVSYRLAPPTLGQHTDEVLAELGYTLEEVASLRMRDVI